MKSKRTITLWVVRTKNDAYEIEPGAKTPEPYEFPEKSYAGGFRSPMATACKWWARRLFPGLKVGEPVSFIMTARKR